MGYCSFQKTAGCYALVDDAGKTIAHVHGRRHLKLFRFAWDAQETLKAVEALCSQDPDNPVVRQVAAKISELNRSKNAEAE